MNTLYLLLAQIYSNDSATKSREIFTDVGRTAYVFWWLLCLVIIILLFFLPLFVFFIHRNIRRQNVMIKQLVDNSVIISQQLSRLPQANPPGARR